MHFLPVPGTVGIADEGGGCSLHAPARDIKGGFHGIGHGMGRRGDITQGVDHGGEYHKAQGGGEGTFFAFVMSIFTVG